MALSNGLLIADVAHRRMVPRSHALHYRVYYLCFPLQRLQDLACRVLSVSGFNLFGFYEKDHAFGGKRCEDWARGVLAENGLTACDGDTVLLTMPRILGYVFNPVSFWFCLDTEGNLRAVIAEVNNTFGERHAYLCAHTDQRVIAPEDRLETQKVFHVSPFLDVRGQYRFRFRYGEDVIGAWIDYIDEGKTVLTTSLTGHRRPLHTRSLLGCFFRYPLITLKVTLMIHVHALRMVLKGFRYRVKPPLNSSEVTR